MKQIKKMFSHKGKTTNVVGTSRIKTYHELYKHISEKQGKELPYHGDYLGDYNLLLKGGWLKESICRVPFIWSDPQAEQRASADTLASTVDIAATILGRAGIDTVNGNQGHSLLQATQQETQVRNSLLIEENDPVPRYNYPTPARVRQVLKDNWSLTLVQGDSNGELYNRNEDPNECDNLWDNPLHQTKQAEMVLALSHLLIQQMDESPKAQRYA